MTHTLAHTQILTDPFRPLSGAEEQHSTHHIAQSRLHEACTGLFY